MFKRLILFSVVIFALGFAQDNVVMDKIDNDHMAKLESRISELERELAELKTILVSTRNAGQLDDNKLTQPVSQEKMPQKSAPDSRVWLEGTKGWTQVGDILYPNSITANVGIGTTSPGQWRLYVQGDIRGIYGSGISCGVDGQSENGYGVYGNSNNGKGVYGYSYSNDGVYGMSMNGTGVYGWSNNYDAVSGNSSSGVGVYAHSTDYHGMYGVSTNGIGVRGHGATYDFYAAGPGTNYGPFTGAHEVELSDDFPENIKSGMIVSVTGKAKIRKTDEGKISFSTTLPTVQLSDAPDDSKVFGVLISECPLGKDHWYFNEVDKDDRFGIANALGEGRVWVTSINGDIDAGDYITTSAIAGYGQRQSDALLHSYTLGKAIEDIDWSKVTETVEFNGKTYKAYPIAVVYTSG
ncbi:MAG: hypothetical protein WBB67_09805 [bacterium]